MIQTPTLTITAANDLAKSSYADTVELVEALLALGLDPDSDADELSKRITAANDRLLDRIRTLHGLPPAPTRRIDE